MDPSSPRIQHNSVLNRKKPPKIQISHRVVMRAQSSSRTSRPTNRSRQATSAASTTVQQTPSNLKKYPKKESLKPMKSKSLLQDQELIALREALANGSNIESIETQKLQLLIGHLREYCQFCGLQRHYFEAKETMQLIEKVNCELNNRSIVKNNYNDDLDSFETQKDEEIDRLSQEIIDFDEETELKREILKQKQEKEYQNFELIWKIEMPRKYRKLSPQLLNLMTSEKKCARCGDFDKAEAIKKEVDTKMKIELEQAQKSLNLDFLEAKERMIENQAKEMALFEENREHARIVMIARHNEELKPLANRKTIIEIKKAKQPKIDIIKCHSTTTGNVSKVINDIGLDYEALLPPLLDPTDPTLNTSNKHQKSVSNIKTKEKNSQSSKKPKYQNSLSTKSSSKSVKSETESVTNSDTVFQTQDMISGFLTNSTNENIDNFNESHPDNIQNEDKTESHDDLLRAKAIALINEVDRKTNNANNLKNQMTVNSDNAE